MVQDCSYALIPDTTKSKLSLHQKIAMYYMIDQSHFEKMKLDAGAGASFPIGDIIVSPEMKWNQFNEKRNEKLTEYKFDSTTDFSSDFFSSMLSSASVEAYKACLDSNRPVGLVTAIAVGTPYSKEIGVKITFNTAAGDSTQRRFYHDGFNYTLTKKSESRMDAPFKSSEEFTVYFERDETKQTLFSVHVSNSGKDGDSSIQIPPKPRLYKNIPQKRMKSGTLNLHTSGGDSGFVPASIVPDLANGWSFDTNSPITWTAVNAGHVSKLTVQPLSLTKTGASIHGIVHADGGYDAGASVTFYAVEEINPTWVDITDHPELA